MTTNHCYRLYKIELFNVQCQCTVAHHLDKIDFYFKYMYVLVKSCIVRVH